MPSEIILTGGERMKVTASFQDVRDCLAAGTALSTTRFAGFRGEDAVGAEDVLVVAGAIAAVVDITGP